MYRFHVVSLPHTNTTLAFSSCAYTEKVRKFCRMMIDELHGHEVFLYAGAENEAPCTEHIPCISEAERVEAVGDRHYTTTSFERTLPHWIKFNSTVIQEMRKRVKPRDFICIIAGDSNEMIADAFPSNMTVEFGIGYGGSFSKYRVWESYAWMHTCYGAQQKGGALAADGRWFDAVIPGYLEEERFPFSEKTNGYYLYVGRIIDRKGVHVAVKACERANVRLIVAGIGEPLKGCEFVGEVLPEQRASLMSHAIALLAPTLYIEPFGNVVTEAMACGTPVITTDWGAFTETNVQGVTGFRCRTLREFTAALEKVHDLDRAAIRKRALAKYSLPVVAVQYENYFDRLYTLWDEDGWNAE